MIDFIKIIVRNINPSILEANPLLEFYDNVNLNTGQLKTTNRNGNKVTPSKNASFNGLEFKIYDTGTITLSGSLHKYWNNGAHNYNDFNVQAVNWVLNDLKEKFDIEPENCILKCLEIGINVIPPIPTNEILDYSLLHKTLPFEYQKNSDEGKYKQAQHSQYIVKLYNKALHYLSKGFKISDEIMRFEIKYTKMQKLNEKGIFNLNDLLKHGLHNFKSELLKEWQNVLFFDNTIQIDTLSAKTKTALLEYSNLTYWTGLINNKQTKNFRYHKNQLKKITFKNSNKIQKLTSEIMSKKIDFLNMETIQIDTLSAKTKTALLEYSNLTYWTGLINNKQTKNFRYHKNQLKKITFKNSNKIQKLTSEIMSKKIDFLNMETIQIDTLTIQSKRIVLNSSNSPVCRITNINISMQKNDSILLSHTGLKYYYKTDKKVFEQIKRQYLSEVWFKSDFEKQIKEIAHNIRNTKSNQSIKQKRIYKPEQLNILALLEI